MLDTYELVTLIQTEYLAWASDILVLCDCQLDGNLKGNQATNTKRNLICCSIVLVLVILLGPVLVLVVSDWSYTVLYLF